jgi:hypothetical protein
MKPSTIGRRALLGAGALALAMPRAKADVPFSSFAFQASDTPTARTMPERLGETKNVKDYGAIGNGLADDTAAIQRAVNRTSAPFSLNNRGTIYFPTGTYRITAPITFGAEAGIAAIAFSGAPGALIQGNFADALLKRDLYAFGPQGGVFRIDNLRFMNNHPTGKGVMLHSCVGGKIVGCQFSGCWRAIETYGSQSILVDSCSIIGQQTSNSIGVVAGNATAVVSTDVSGYDHGIRHQNVGLTVHGGRFEVNNAAVVVGLDENGNGFQSSGFDIAGLSMEANQTGIYVAVGAGGSIRGISMGGGVPMMYGLRLGSCQDVVVQGVVVSGAKGYSQAGIAIENATRTVLMSVCSVSSTAWALPANQSQITFIQSNKP